MHLRELRRHAGRFVIAGFSGDSVSDDLRRLAREFDLGGIVFAAHNLIEPRQIADLSRELQGLAADWPLWISVEHDGGAAAVLPPPFTRFPSICALGRSGAEKLAARYATVIAAELLAAGINLNQMPVLDIATSRSGAVPPERSLGDREDVVTRLGRVLARTMQEEGVAGCAGHFPGLGSAASQGENQPLLVEDSPDKLRAVDLRPFSAAIDEKIAAVMMGRALVPAFDERRLAAVSEQIVAEILKKECGFDGVVLADVPTTGRPRTNGEANFFSAYPVAAVQAGCDVLWMPDSNVDVQVEALEAIIRAGESAVIPAKRIEDAWTRQRTTKERFLGRRSRGGPALDIIGCLAHQRVADEMREWE